MLYGGVKATFLAPEAPEEKKAALRGFVLPTHNALIQPVPYTDFDLLNLTSQTLFIVFLGLLSDIGETYTPCFVDYANTNTNTNTNTNR